MINRVILVGNLTRDPDSVSSTGRPMTRMRLATNSQWRDAEGNRQEAVEYHTVVAFARLAEVCAQYCRKGMRVYLEGRLRTREYDGSDGIRRNSTEIVADLVRFLQPREAGGSEAAEEQELAEAAGSTVA